MLKIIGALRQTGLILSLEHFSSMVYVAERQGPFVYAIPPLYLRMKSSVVTFLRCQVFSVSLTVCFHDNAWLSSGALQQKKALKYDSDERDLDNLLLIWVTAESCRGPLSTDPQQCNKAAS